MGLNVHQRSFGVIGVKRSFSPNILVHITYLDHRTDVHTLALESLPMLWVKGQPGVIWGHGQI